jgi:nicotinamidase-related amidase
MAELLGALYRMGREWGRQDVKGETAADDECFFMMFNSSVTLGRGGDEVAAPVDLHQKKARESGQKCVAWQHIDASTGGGSALLCLEEDDGSWVEWAKWASEARKADGRRKENQKGKM